MGPDGHPGVDAERVEDRLAADAAGLCALVDLGVQIHGRARPFGGTQWLIYGCAADAEEVILASYDDVGEAEAVLRAVRC
jgi:hypothetical protein